MQYKQNEIENLERRLQGIVLKVDLHNQMQVPPEIKYTKMVVLNVGAF